MISSLPKVPKRQWHELSIGSTNALINRVVNIANPNVELLYASIGSVISHSNKNIGYVGIPSRKHDDTYPSETHCKWKLLSRFNRDESTFQLFVCVICGCYAMGNTIVGDNVVGTQYSYNLIIGELDGSSKEDVLVYRQTDTK